MRARQSEVLDTANKIQSFLDQHADVIGPNMASARQNLDDATAQLKAMAVTQSGSVIVGKGQTARQKALRASLRKSHMVPVATVAQVLLPDTPEIGALAVKTKTMGSTQLVAAAHGMADAATPYASIFTANGLPDDFIPQLRAAADAVTTAVNGRQQAVATSNGAVSGMAVQEGRVRALIRLINALVVPKLGTDATLLAEWKNARAIGNPSLIAPVPTLAAPATAATAAASTTAAAASPAPAATASPAPAATTPSTTPAAAPAPAASPSPSSTAPASAAAPSQGA